MKHPASFSPLRRQLYGVLAHNRQGSRATKEAYRGILQRFADFLEDEFQLQRLRRFDERHVNAYVEHLAEEGKATSTIQTTLSAIQKLYQMLHPGHELPESGSFLAGLERVGPTIQNWPHQKVLAFGEYCRGEGAEHFADAALLKWDTGLPLRTCLALKTPGAESALRTGHVLVKHRSGKATFLPVGAEGKAALDRRLAVTEKGGYLFLSKGVSLDDGVRDFGELVTRFCNLTRRGSRGIS